jgi:hypothetical protein
MLDRRYDEIKSDKVKLIPGDEVEGYSARKAPPPDASQPIHDRIRAHPEACCNRSIRLRIYSCRRAASGSIRDARLAGT